MPDTGTIASGIWDNHKRDVSVGLGKTFEALAVIKYFELRNKSVLVLCPKKLSDNWLNYNSNLTTNIFGASRL